MSLPRRRLTALLSGSSTESVSLLVAPPGYGKTTALLEHAADQPNTVWISPPVDGDLEGFVREFVLAVAPNAIRSLATVFAKQGTDAFDDDLLRWLLGRLRTFRGSLIIDDLHRINARSGCLALLGKLVDATHERLRWYLSSREMPALPIGTWIARGWMGLPITADDLAFDNDEAAALATLLGLATSSSDIEGIVAETQGWPIGVRLSLDLTNRNTLNRPIRIRTREILFNYVETEIWERLDSNMRDIIFACAIIPRPTVAMLTAAGFNDAADAIDQLDATVPFIQKDTNGSFLVHDLFREYVLDKTRRAPEAISKLTRRIAANFSRESRFAESLQLYLNAELADGVLAVLESGGFTLLETGHRAEVIAALDFVQARGFLDHAVSCALRAALAAAAGSGSAAESLYLAALRSPPSHHFHFETALRFSILQNNRGNSRAALDLLTPLLAVPELSIDQQVELRSQCAAALASVGLSVQSREAIATTEEALGLLGSEARVRVMCRLGLACFHLGDLARAESFSHEAAILASNIGMDYCACAAYSVLYNVASMTDDDDRRALYFVRSLGASAEKAADMAWRVWSLRTEFVTYAERGDDDGMRATTEILSTMTDARTFQNDFAMRVARSIADAAKGNAQQAISSLNSLADSTLSGGERAYRESLIGFLAILNGNRELAAASVERTLLVNADSDFGSKRYVSLAFCFRGLVLWALDRRLQAQRALSLDETLMGPRDAVLVMAIRDVVMLARPLPNAKDMQPAVDRLNAVNFGGFARILAALASAQASGAQLTAAEIEILRAFNDLGGRTTDIANALNKSPHTVQTQLKSAIRKIGCNGRGEALAYARKHGWLEVAGHTQI